MQITINQQEIEAAVTAYVSEQGIVITDRKVNVSLTAGRGPNGMTATIDIQPKQVVTGSCKDNCCDALPEAPLVPEEDDKPPFDIEEAGAMEESAKEEVAGDEAKADDSLFGK